MMNYAYGKHWMEDAIGNERQPDAIIKAISCHPKFQELVSKSIEVALSSRPGEANQTRAIVEQIIKGISQSISGFGAT